MRKYFFILILLLSVAFSYSCSIIKNDKCWISEEKYIKVKKYFNETDSLNLTLQHLKDEHWSRCEINEAKYRLIKEFDLEKE